MHLIISSQHWEYAAAGTYLVHNTDFIVARCPTAAFVTVTGLAQAVQHVCSSLVGVELGGRLGQPAGATHLHISQTKAFSPMWLNDSVHRL